MVKGSAFTVIGSEIRTQNAPGKAEHDIPLHWDHFFAQGLLNQIPNRKSDTLYVLYSDYEGDYTKPYKCLIGCEVSEVDDVPDNMVVKRIPEQNYHVLKIQGPMPGVLIKAWQDIWSSDLDRDYTCDYEVYKSQTEVDIYIALRK